MAILDKTFYRGTDAYSDGDEAEETLLHIVREGKSLDSLEEISWPVFYHLSPVRENICNWYPFQKGSRVLEVGAGCGAVTGALCDRGLEVCAADLSLRRSMINYERHKDCEGLRLMVGNLNDMAFKEPFDYVLLIGVLEYAGKFTEGDHPWQTFLENIRAFLKPKGKLLIAIENRLGLKYFAGAPEDHLGEPFTGLRGYDPDTGIRTFSRSELSHLLESSGFHGYRFFYPYPDYKFPQEIFTEASLKAQHYGKPYQVFDRKRTDIFSETELAPILAEDGAAGALSNSFLVEASAEEADCLTDDQICYAKLNAGRRACFRIGTIIQGEEQPALVLKFAQNRHAASHINRIIANENTLRNDRKVLEGKQAENRLIYPYCSLPTLEEGIRQAIQEKNAEKIIEIFRSIRDLAAVHPASILYDTPAFSEWFGTERLRDRKCLCVQPANVDLVPDNIFVKHDELIMTDCEWVTDFPVPLGFIIWRSMENTCLKIPSLVQLISREELYRNLDISPEEIDIYRSWQWHFENNYVSDGCNNRVAKPITLSEYTPIQAERMGAEIKSQQAHIAQLTVSERKLKGETESQAAHIEQLEQSERELKGRTESQAAHIEKLIQSERELKGETESQAAHIEQLEQSERELKGKTESQAAHIEQLEQSERELKGKTESQAAHIEQLEQSERELKGRTESQAAHIEKLIKSERELKGETESQAAHIEQLEQSERKLKGETESQAAHIEQLKQSERDLKGKTESQAAHIEKLIQSERTLKGEAENRAAHIEQLLQSERDLKGKTENQAAKIELLLQSEQTLKTENEGLAQEVERLRTELDTVYQSTSWKVTGPLRNISKKIRPSGK